MSARPNTAAAEFGLVIPEPAKLVELPGEDAPEGELELVQPVHTESAPAVLPVEVELVRPAHTATAEEAVEIDVEVPAPAAPHVAANEAPHLETKPGTTLWPSSVPSVIRGQESLFQAVNGAISAEPHTAAVTARVAAELTPAERAAFTAPQPVDLEAVALRTVAGTRWRLSIALDTVPARGTPMDQAALDALTDEVDQAFATLGSLCSENASQELIASAAAIRNAMAGQAEAFGRKLHRPVTRALQVVKPLVPAPAAKNPQVTAIRFASLAPRAPRVWLRGVIAAAVVVSIGAFLLHDDRDGPTANVIDGAPSEMVGMENPESGIILLRTRDQRPPPAEFQTYAKRMMAQGWTVTERPPLGTGNFVLTHPPKANSNY